MAGKDDEKDDIIIVEGEEADNAASGDIDSSKEGDAEKVAQKKTPVRKRGNDQQKRLNEIWLGRKEAEEAAMREADRARVAEARSTQYEQITASALEENTNTKRELLKERLIRAQETGDAKSIAEIQVSLGKVEAEAAQIERYKIENKIQQKPQQPAPQRQQQEVQVSPDEMYDRMSPAGKKWLDDNNDWYADDSENHDPEKSGDVKYYAQTLEQDLIRSGRAAEIGTRGYFNTINNYIKQNWSDNVQGDDDEENDAPAIQPKKNYAAPVGNRSANATPNPTRREYKITQAEKELALSLDTKDTKGKPLSDNDKIKRFIGLRDSTPSSGPISMKTISKGA